MTDAERDLAWRVLWFAIIAVAAGGLAAVLGVVV